MSPEGLWMSFHLLWIRGNTAAWNRRSSWLGLCLGRERGLGLNHKAPPAPGAARNAAQIPCPGQHRANSASALLGDHWHSAERSQNPRIVWEKPSKVIQCNHHPWAAPNLPPTATSTHSLGTSRGAACTPHSDPKPGNPCHEKYPLECTGSI